jgi:hypothetical protein
MTRHCACDGGCAGCVDTSSSPISRAESCDQCPVCARLLSRTARNDQLLFQRYAQEHPQITAFAKQDKSSEWQWVQKRFEKMGLHRKQGSGLNIWACEVTGPRKSRRLHGYPLSDPAELFDEQPADNPYLRLVSEEREVGARSQ